MAKRGSIVHYLSTTSSAHGTSLTTALTPCVPQSPHDDRFEGCYSWCAKNMSASCKRCKCRACSFCRSKARLPMAQREPTCGTPLVVVVRGEAFRDGAARSRKSTNDPWPELATLHSVRERVLQPARAAGWSPLLMADVTVPRAHEARFSSYVRGEALQAVAVRMRPLGENQVGSLGETLRWAHRAAFASLARDEGGPSNGQGESDGGGSLATLVLRADLQIKKPLRLPQPTEGASDVRVPFRCDWLRKDVAAEADDWAPCVCVSDAVFFVP